MPITREESEELQTIIADVEAHASSTSKEAHADVDLEHLAVQIQNLLQSSRKYVIKHHANDSSDAASSGADSDNGSQGIDSTGTDTPPTIATSSCPTPTRDTVGTQSINNDVVCQLISLAVAQNTVIRLAIHDLLPIIKTIIWL